MDIPGAPDHGLNLRGTPQIPSTLPKASGGHRVHILS
jgi:hypothetical protein